LQHIEGRGNAVVGEVLVKIFQQPEHPGFYLVKINFRHAGSLALQITVQVALTVQSVEYSANCFKG
jgi:hypothetical protein